MGGHVRRNVTSEILAKGLEQKTSAKLMEELDQLVAPNSLWWDEKEGGTHIIDPVGRGVAFLQESVLPGTAEPYIDGLLPAWIQGEEERRITALMNEVAPYFLELHARKQEGRNLFDVDAMRPLEA